MMDPKLTPEDLDELEASLSQTHISAIPTMDARQLIAALREAWREHDEMGKHHDLVCDDRLRIWHQRDAARKWSKAWKAKATEYRLLFVMRENLCRHHSCEMVRGRKGDYLYCNDCETQLSGWDD